MLKSKRLGLTALMLIFLMPMFMFGDGTLDFVIPALNSGKLSYAGGSNPLVGQNIQISSVLGYGGTENSFDLVGINNGELDFTSGSATGSWAWGTGGSLGVTATGTIGDFTGTLLQGTFNDVYLQSTWAHFFDLTFGGFNGTVSSSLSNFYGFSSPSVDGSLEMLAYIGASQGQSFSNAPVLLGAVKAVDPVNAAEGGGFLTSLGILLIGGLCLALGARLRVFKLAL